jgi:RNA polymerase-binding transcription factor DksA
MMNTARTKRIKATLEARRAALLLACMHNVAEEDALLADREPDLLDVGAERSAATVLGKLAEAEREEILRIDAALARIADESWGICEACGERIRDARLEAIPEAARCLECEMASHRSARDLA